MSKENSRRTWKQPWSYREGTIITMAILLFGFGLQAIGGGIIFLVAGFPWNLISGIIMVSLLILLYYFWHKHPFIKWLSGVKAALPAILGFTFMVLLMGFVKQDVQPKNEITRLFGLTDLVKSWPFILINLYLMMLLGMVTLRRLIPFNLKNAGFFVNHFGLFLVLFSTALGNSDMERVTLNCRQDEPKQQAIKASGEILTLPFSVKLLNFNIDEFRPKVGIVDNKTGDFIKKDGNPELVLLDQNDFEISSYHIKVEQFLAYSKKVNDSYVEQNESGSSPAAKISISAGNGSAEISGWICSGSNLMHPEILKINDAHSLLMLPSEPRNFSSEISIQTQNGKNIHTTIEVNKPVKVDGWTIYQLGYDTQEGRWSKLSIFDLVRDPWLPVVYLGIFLMMAGAGFLFVFGKPNDGGTKNVA